VEVDLTARLEAVESEAPGNGDSILTAPRHGEPAGRRIDGTPGTGTGLESAFDALRQEAAGQIGGLLALGRTYVSAGLHDQAIEAFVTAAHDPARRYEASVALAELYGDRRDAAASVEWLERAAETAPSDAKRGAVLYRLGVLLEGLGETSRALAVLLELMTIAPHFRDVAARVARLGGTPPGGASSVR
jgi:tetratricopeptide (TPR) repeat protein